MRRRDRAVSDHTDTTLTDTERDSLTECECGHYLNEHSSDGCLANDHDGDLCVCMATPDLIRERAIVAIVAARLAAARAEQDALWRERLTELPDQMSGAWGGGAPWLTTGDKVATLVGDWLRALIEGADQ